MNSEDVRNDPRMKAHWNELNSERRRLRVLTIIGTALLFAALLAALTLGGCRRPIIITGGGHGGGNGSTVEGGK